MIEENTLIRFFGIYDGHGDFGKEASILANQDFEAFIRANIKKILKLRDQRDYKEKVKKMMKVMYMDCQKKYEKNVRGPLYYPVCPYRKRYTRNPALQQSASSR